MNDPRGLALLDAAVRCARAIKGSEPLISGIQGL